MVTVPPCDAGQLCSATLRGMDISKSRKRRLRDRRVAVRRSQQTSVALRRYLLGTDGFDFFARDCLVDGAAFHWNAFAACFHPGTCVEKEDVAPFVALDGDDCVEHQKGSIAAATTADVLEMRRKELRQTCVADQLPAIPLPDAGSIQVNMVFVPERAALKDPCCVEMLPIIQSPLTRDCSVVVDRFVASSAHTTDDFDRKTHLVIEKRLQMYRSAVGNKKLRGCFLKDIGDESPARDDVMMIAGKVKVLEVAAERLKVSGKATPGDRDDLHYAVGWIDKINVRV